MADFPPGSLALKEDSKYRTQQQADPAQRQEVDGGYVITRPRFTRTPRKTFTTGFTLITDAEKVLLENFWDAHKGGSESFTWLDPVSGITYTVRFKGQPNFKYSGRGMLVAWDVDGISLEQV